MKLIEALKKIKELQRKAEDLRTLVAQHSAISSLQTATYPDQKKKISEWIQSHSDILKEIMRLRIAIQKTNLTTEVSIQLNGKAVKKTIAEWIHRRRDLAKYEFDMWRKLTDRNIQEGMSKTPSGDMIEVKINRFYDPETRDEKLAFYQEEPSIIDSNLEIANAVTDLEE